MEYNIKRDDRLWPKLFLWQWFITFLGDGPFDGWDSIVLNIPQFAMFVHCPLSASVHIEVALKASSEVGMI